MSIYLDAIYEANRLVFHPLGLNLFVRRDGELIMVERIFDSSVEPHHAELDAGAAARVADAVEAHGPGRIERLGYVIQPLPPEVKQLHVTVRETVPLPDEAL